MNEVKEKKPFYKRWWFIVLIAFIIFGMLANTFESDGSKQAKKDDEIAAQKVKDDKKAEKEEAKKRAQTLAKEEASKKENAKVDKSPAYTPEDETNAAEGYAWVMDQSKGNITNIKPLNDDSYEVIYAYLANEVKLLNDNEKQYFVDEWGPSIIGQTRANIYGGDASKMVSVFFKYEDGSAFADPGLLGEGWKIKK